MNAAILVFTIVLTVSVYALSRILFLRYKHPLLNPVVVRTGVIIVATGMIGPLLLTLLGISHPVARGVALGMTAHGQGTAIALLEGQTQGAMAGIATALTAVSTSFIAPAYIPFLLGVLGASAGF